MNIQTGWPLLLTVPLFLWFVLEWGKSRRRLGLLLKVLALAAVCLALARPQWLIQETYTAVALISDASNSIPIEQRGQQQLYLQRARAVAGGHSLRPLEFGSFTARSVEGPTLQGSTNLEAAIRDAMGTLPADRIPRLVLLSDGQSNSGAVERAVYQARARQIPIDTFVLAGRQAPDFRLASVRIPMQAFAGERFPIELEVDAPEPMQARLELTADGQPIGGSDLTLAQGRGIVTAHARIETPGTSLIEGTLLAPEHGQEQLTGTVAIHSPKALLISSDPDYQNTHLTGVIQAAGFSLKKITQVAALAADPEFDYDIIICSNEDFVAWPVSIKEQLAEFVQEGGGFLMISGERNLYRERTDYDEDALDTMLPATLAPPRIPEGTAVILVVDKSSSMEGKKMQLARQSAIGVVENLRPIDSVGVLAFDNSFEWAVPLQRNAMPENTQSMISGIIADGGTQIAPALKEAYRFIKPQNAVYKHILLLTDGISEEGNSIALAQEAAANEVTISTIGLGQDVNRSYLERIARNAAGKSYFPIDISALEQIVLRDVMEHTGSSVTEQEFIPTAKQEYEVLKEIDLEQPGPLLGWLRYETKPEAQTILEAPDEDPLLVQWQYGLGRSAVFASDAKDRWAANWIGWNGYDLFWSNILRDLLPRVATTETLTEYDTAKDEIVIRYFPSDRTGLQEEPLELYAVGPQGYTHVTPTRQIPEGYEARFPVKGLFGLFRIRPENESRIFPEVAYYRKNSELDQYGANSELMRSIALATGGRVNPAPEELFSSGGRSVERWMGLWPLLLALAIFLNLLELLARKGWLPILGRWA